MKAHFFVVIALGLLFSAIGWGVVLSYSPFPVAASEQADLVDEAFTFLTILGVPIFSFVIAALLYSGIRFRKSGTPSADGPPTRTHTPFVVGWLAVTTVLTFLVIVHPGITGIQELRAHDNEEPDLLVQLEGRRFSWGVKYPEQGVQSFRELVLPIDQVTLFKVTSFDVIHSAWIPAFRMKIDAVPGMTTRMIITPNKFGTMDEDPNFRLQCAELCGAGHAVMRLPVRVVTDEEFDAWIAEQRPITQ